jgi:hypothetical protein
MYHLSMRRAARAALLAALCLAPAFAQKPAGKTAPESASFKEADRLLEDLSRRAGELRQCQAALAAQRAEFAARKKAVVGKDGKVPEAYGGLLEIKQARLRRLHDECAQMDLALNRDLDASEAMIRNLEPRSSPAVAARRTRLNGVRGSLKSAAPKAAGPKAAAKPE